MVFVIVCHYGWFTNRFQIGSISIPSSIRSSHGYASNWNRMVFFSWLKPLRSIGLSCAWSLRRRCPLYPFCPFYLCPCPCLFCLSCLPASSIQHDPKQTKISLPWLALNGGVISNLAFQTRKTPGIDEALAWDGNIGTKLKADWLWTSKTQWYSWWNNVKYGKILHPSAKYDVLENPAWFQNGLALCNAYFSLPCQLANRYFLICRMMVASTILRCLDQKNNNFKYLPKKVFGAVAILKQT